MKKILKYLILPCMLFSKQVQGKNEVTEDDKFLSKLVLPMESSTEGFSLTQIMERQILSGTPDYTYPHSPTFAHPFMPGPLDEHVAPADNPMAYLLPEAATKPKPIVGQFCERFHKIVNIIADRVIHPSSK